MAMAQDMLIKHCYSASSINPQGRGLGRAKKLMPCSNSLNDALYHNGGHPPKDYRLMVEVVFCACAPARLGAICSRCFGPWAIVYGRFRRWTIEGLWPRLLRYFCRAVATRDDKGQRHYLAMIQLACWRLALVH